MPGQRRPTRNRGVAGWAFGFGLVTVLSGCLGGSAPFDGDAAVSPAPKSSMAAWLDETFGAPLEGASKVGSDWWVAIGSAGPGGVVSVFSWTFPEGGLGVVPGSQPPRRVASIDAVPIVDPAAGSPQAWAAAFIHVRAGVATLLRLDWGADGVERVRTPAGVQEFPLAAQSGAFRGMLCCRTLWTPPGGVSVEPGDEMVVVLAAKQKGPAEFGLAFTIHPREFQASDGPPPPDLARFAANRSSPTPSLLSLGAQAVGLNVSAYQSAPRRENELWADVEKLRGEIHVRDDSPAPSRPYAYARFLTLKATHEVPHGLTATQGNHFRIGVLGPWTVDAHLHGSRFHNRSVTTLQGASAVGVPFEMAFGVPAFSFVAEGRGRAATEWRRDYVNAVGLLDAVDFHQVTFGAPLSELVGVQASTVHRASVGLVGNLPP